mmetsp:Transcript_80779/g.250733  ORF Transcript_80779/g.250733 Transcript_80779/m.250733 type:complete len:229 (-) Transcript_80779:44-730(-)
MEVYGCRGAAHGLVPGRRVEMPSLAARRVVEVPGREALVAAAGLVQRLELAGDVDGAVGAPAHVEGDDADGVAGNEVGVALHVPDDEGKHAANLVLREEVHAVLGVEVQEHLAIALRQELVLPGGAGLELLTELHVVVDLPVHAQDDVVRLVVERLVAAVRVHNGQALVRDDGATLAIDAAPVGATVPQELGSVHDFLACRVGRLQAEEGQDAAHGRRPKRIPAACAM